MVNQERWLSLACDIRQESLTPFLPPEDSPRPFLSHLACGSTPFFSFLFSTPLSGMDEGKRGQKFFKVLACSGFLKQVTWEPPLRTLQLASQVNGDLNKSQFPKSSRKHPLARLKPDHLLAPTAFSGLPCSIQQGEFHWLELMQDHLSP